MSSQWYAKTLATPAVEGDSSWYQDNDDIYEYDDIEHLKCINECQSVFVNS